MGYFSGREEEGGWSVDEYGKYVSHFRGGRGGGGEENSNGRIVVPIMA